MTMTKMTKKDYFKALRAEVEGKPELVAFIDHEIELLEKKNSAKANKPTKKQTENAVMIEKIYTAMESGKGYTASDILEMFPELNSVQKASAMVTAMRKNLMVTREITKGKAYFHKV